MSHWRALWRVPALMLVTFVVYATWLLTRLVALVAPAWGVRAHHACVRAWARAFTRILNVRVEAIGSPGEPPYFLVANHLSYLDIVVLFTLVEARFVAKSEVARWPVMGFLARTTGTLFIDRARKSDLNRVLAEIEAVMQDGGAVVVFPEGTSTQGATVVPFKASVFEAPLRTGVPVAAACIGYSTPEHAPPAHLAVCWWGDMTFLRHCWGLSGLERIDARVEFAPDPVRADDRKSLAQRAHAAVHSMFVPVVEPGA